MKKHSELRLSVEQRSHNAFSGIKLGDGTSLRQAEVIDNYGEGIGINDAGSASRPARTWPIRQQSVFLLIVAALLALAVFLTPPAFHGDAAEYTQMTISIARHGTPDITEADVRMALRLTPGFSWHHNRVLDHISSQRQLPPGFLLGVDGKIHAIHTFGYSALATVIEFRGFSRGK